MAVDLIHDHNEEVIFEVGKKFANRKGNFEVVSISGSKMEIKWDNGDTIDTTIEQQERIIKNMLFEKYLAQEALKKPKKGKTKAASKFVGLIETDFTPDIKGTTWRNRNGLGGLVMRSLESKKYKFLSHPIYRKAGVFWQDDQHRDPKKVKNQAKFFAKLDESHMSCGFSVERSPKETDDMKDWNGFMKWVGDAENEDWLKKSIEDQSYQIDVELNKRSIHHSETLALTNDKWMIKKNGKENKYKRLQDYINMISEDIRVNVQVIKSTPKDEVMEMNLKVGENISSVIKSLMPLYDASVDESKMTD